MFRRIKNKALMAGAVLLAVFLLSGCSANKVTTSTNQGVQGQMSNSNTIEEQQKNPSDDKTTEQKAVETGVLSEELIKKEKTGAGKKGVWYGELRQFSMSGSMKFYYKDNVSREKLKNGDSPWFWASMSDDQVKYVGANGDAAFRITGTKLGEDCGYIGDGTCLEEIHVEKIEIIK